MNISKGFELHGRFQRCANDKEVLVEGLRAMGHRHPDALDRLVEEYGHPFQKRHHVARDRGGVYPHQPKLIHEVVEFLPGYFVGTNENSDTKLKLLMECCYLADIEYGRDFRATCLEMKTGELRQRLESRFNLWRRLGLDPIGRGHETAVTGRPPAAPAESVETCE